MGERMNQQRDFAAPFTGCEQLNKSLAGESTAEQFVDLGIMG